MRKVVLSFFDYTGIAVRPWAEQGYDCYCYDMQHPTIGRIERVGAGTITYVKADLSMRSNDWPWLFNTFRRRMVAMVFGFPPCTDLAASGARHWAAKRAADPLFQVNAVGMAMMVATLADELKAPFMIENPQGALSTQWRKPDHRFQPCEYGGYLPEDDQHPIWPDHIMPRDAYTKLTCLWTGNGFVMPETKPVEPVMVEYVKKGGQVTRGSIQWGKLGGKSLKTKNIRSATPRGFVKALFEANHKGQLQLPLAA